MTLYCYTVIHYSAIHHVQCLLSCKFAHNTGSPQSITVAGQAAALAPAPSLPAATSALPEAQVTSSHVLRTLPLCSTVMCSA